MECKICEQIKSKDYPEYGDFLHLPYDEKNSILVYKYHSAALPLNAETQLKYLALKEIDDWILKELPNGEIPPHWLRLIEVKNEDKIKTA